MKILGSGFSVGPKEVKNEELSTYVDTSDEWIQTRTGIQKRYFGSDLLTLAVEATAEALKGYQPEEIDLVIVATVTHDQLFPSASSKLAGELGLNCGTLDLNGACAGWVYATIMASAMIASGLNKILVVGSERMERIIDFDDRSTAVLFGNGAGAVLLGAGNRIMGSDMGTDGSLKSILYSNEKDLIKMEGSEVFKTAVRASINSCNTALEKAGLNYEDVDILIPHQANRRITDALSKRMGLSDEKVISTVEWTANTSSASIPIALSNAIDEGKIKTGDKMLLTGFGSGMTWASAVTQVDLENYI